MQITPGSSAGRRPATTCRRPRPHARSHPQLPQGRPSKGTRAAQTRERLTAETELRGARSGLQQGRWTRSGLQAPRLSPAGAQRGQRAHSWTPLPASRCLRTRSSRAPFVLRNREHLPRRATSGPEAALERQT